MGGFMELTTAITDLSSNFQGDTPNLSQEQIDEYNEYLTHLQGTEAYKQATTDKDHLFKTNVDLVRFKLGKAQEKINKEKKQEKMGEEMGELTGSDHGSDHGSASKELEETILNSEREEPGMIDHSE